MSRPTQDTTSLIHISCTGLSPISPSFPTCSTIQLYWTSQSYNPNSAETKLVWATSSSLAATTEITIVFFSCTYLDVSVQCVRLPYGMTGLQPAGFPHSEMFGSIDICSSPNLIAAYHVFLRLSEPRHPPCALSNLLVS